MDNRTMTNIEKTDMLEKWFQTDSQNEDHQGLYLCTLVEDILLKMDKLKNGYLINIGASSWRRPLG